MPELNPRPCNVNRRCPNAADFSITAAYPNGDLEMGHKSLGMYPAPMAIACRGCLADFMIHDAEGPGSTEGWYVQVLP